jgi:hypothetical protein
LAFVVPRHRKDQVGRFDDLLFNAREQRGLTSQVPPLQGVAFLFSHSSHKGRVHVVQVHHNWSSIGEP